MPRDHHTNRVFDARIPRKPNCDLLQPRHRLQAARRAETIAVSVLCAFWTVCAGLFALCLYIGVVVYPHEPLDSPVILALIAGMAVSGVMLVLVPCCIKSIARTVYFDTLFNR